MKLFCVILLFGFLYIVKGERSPLLLWGKRSKLVEDVFKLLTYLFLNLLLIKLFIIKLSLFKQ